MPNLGATEILLILLVLLLLFGARRLPETARGIGRSLRILKTEVKGLHDDDPASQRGEPHVRQLPAVEAGPVTATADAPVVQPVVEHPDAVRRDSPPAT